MLPVLFILCEQKEPKPVAKRGSSLGNCAVKGYIQKNKLSGVDAGQSGYNKAYFLLMHGKFIMLIPMSEATEQDVHMHFMLSDIGLLLSLMLQKSPF
jgi:hypothetical protein